MQLCSYGEEMEFDGEFLIKFLAGLGGLCVVAVILHTVFVDLPATPHKDSEPATSDEMDTNPDEKSY